MATSKKQFSLQVVQWIIWIILFTVHVLSLLPYDSVAQAVVYSAINIGAYLLVIYGNGYFMLPKLYERGHRTVYIVLSVVLIPVIAFVRFYISFWIYQRFFTDKPESIRWSTIMSSLVTVILVYISSILFYMALNFFRLKQKQEQLQKRHTEAELNLLKAQVQPHFLFNTLNNIYFVAQRESPATAVLLEQLSLIMRYFVDEAPKDRITLAAELSFIRSYIELEKMRMRYPLRVTIQEATPEGILVPPMLLIPLVENVFKHGIDKLRNDNYILLALSVQNNRLNVTVENRQLQVSVTDAKSETGLRNVRSRLDLLFEGDHTLQAESRGAIFHARLNIPL